jgi:hypothetical protein
MNHADYDPNMLTAADEDLVEIQLSGHLSALMARAAYIDRQEGLIIVDGRNEDEYYPYFSDDHIGEYFEY